MSGQSICMNKRQGLGHNIGVYNDNMRLPEQAITMMIRS